MRFCYVTEKSVPEETGRLLAEACAQRGIEFISHEAKRFDFAPPHRLRRGDLLYRGAVSVHSSRVETFLYDEGVATFFRNPDDIYFTVCVPPITHERYGAPVPKTLYVGSDDVPLLEKLVDQVGGFPVVLKVLGRSSGVGVMLVESMRSLVSVVSYALAQNNYPLLCQFIPNATHWRLVVVGDRVVGHYKNKHRMGDFRTEGSRDPADFHSPVPAAVERAAVLSVESLRLEFGGVDVLEDVDGNPYVLEANFPCYYPQAQLVAGVDIAGAMVDHLVAKSRRLMLAESEAA
jgi:hypothetical protein